MKWHRTYPVQFWSPIYIIRRNRFSRYILTTAMQKRKCCFISVYAPTNESTVKDPEETRTFYEQLSDIISNINRNVSIIIAGDSNAKTKMRNRDPLLNKIIGKCAKTDINENGEKLIELCNLHILRITIIFKMNLSWLEGENLVFENYND